MGVRKTLHDRVGGFDESLREREDTDYCFRIQLAGVVLHFAAAAIIHIRYSPNAQDLFHQARRWARYQVLLYKRHGNGLPLHRPWLSYLRASYGLARVLPRLFKAESRARWMKAAGTHVGLLEGAIRYRVPPVCQSKASEVASEWAALGGALVIQRMRLSEPRHAKLASSADLGNSPEPARNDAESCRTAAGRMVTFLISSGVPFGAIPI